MKRRNPTLDASMPTLLRNRTIGRAGFTAEELAEFLKAAPDDLVTQSNALVDPICFASGAFVEMGTGAARLFDAIHQASTDKLREGRLRHGPESGTTLKPPGWVGPGERTRRLIEQQDGTEGSDSMRAGGWRSP